MSHERRLSALGNGEPVGRQNTSEGAVGDVMIFRAVRNETTWRTLPASADASCVGHAPLLPSGEYQRSFSFECAVFRLARRQQLLSRSASLLVGSSRREALCEH